MRTCCLFVCLALTAGLGTIAVPAPAAEKSGTEEIDKLIEQLGSGSYAEREEATRKLSAIGSPALDALRKASQSSDDEVRQRADDLVQKIGKRAETEKILAPTRVHLVYKETPVAEAVADFAKKSGYVILLAEGDKAKLADRKVTLDTGNATFWQAFDQFCKAANLVEARPEQMLPIRRPPIRTLPIERPAPQNGAAMPPAGGGLAIAVAVGNAPGAPALGRPLPVPGPVPAPIMPLRPIHPGIYPMYNMNDGRFILADGKPETLPVDYQGAVRIRAMSPSSLVLGTPKRENEILFALEVSPEPKIQWRNLINLRIDKALDENGQNLVQARADAAASNDGPPRAVAQMMARPMYMGNPRQVPVRLKTGDKPSRTLKELKGSISAQVQSPPAVLMTVPDVLKGTNKSAKTSDGASLKVLDLDRADDGTVKIRVQIETPPNIIPAAGAAFGGANIAVTTVIAPAPVARPPVTIAWGGAAYGLALVDAKGEHYQLTGLQSTVTAAGNAVTREFTLTYHLQKDEGTGAKLIFSGSRMVAVEIPFALQDVPLALQSLTDSPSPAK